MPDFDFVNFIKRAAKNQISVPDKQFENNAAVNINTLDKIMSGKFPEQDQKNSTLNHIISSIEPTLTEPNETPEQSDNIFESGRAQEEDQYQQDQDIYDLSNRIKNTFGNLVKHFDAEVEIFDHQVPSMNPANKDRNVQRFKS